jgi:hypothetical protein
MGIEPTSSIPQVCESTHRSISIWAHLSAEFWPQELAHLVHCVPLRVAGHVLRILDLVGRFGRVSPSRCIHISSATNVWLGWSDPTNHVGRVSAPNCGVLGAIEDKKSKKETWVPLEGSQAPLS